MRPHRKDAKSAKDFKTWVLPFFASFATLRCKNPKSELGEGTVPDLIYNLVFIALLGCCGMCLYRIGRGPTAPDRAMAIDILGIVVVCFTAIMAVRTGKDYYLIVGISWALLSFIGAIALAKHLEGKGFDE